jgi:hypothetical protein
MPRSPDDGAQRLSTGNFERAFSVILATGDGERTAARMAAPPDLGRPRGNTSALKSGSYTREALAERKALQDLVRQSRKLIDGVE